MGVEALSRHDVLSESQANAMRTKKLDANGVAEINAMKNQIKDDIKSAADLTMSDKRALEMELSRTRDTDTSGLKKVAEKMRSTMRVNAEFKRVFGDIREEMVFFEKLSPEDKVKYFESLGTKITDLQRYYRDIVRKYPQLSDRISRLGLREKVGFVQEIRERVENEKEYSERLENAVYKGDKSKPHFSKGSQKEYMNMFVELSVTEQRRWKVLFDKTELPERAKLTDEYMMLTPKYQKLSPNFFDLDRSDKKKEIIKIKAALEREHLDTLYGPLAKHMSDDSKAFAKKIFRGGDLTLKVAMLERLEKDMKNEAKLSKKFEGYPDDLKLKYAEFYDRNYEEKEKMLKRMEKDLEAKKAEERERKERSDKYKGKLEREYEGVEINNVKVKAISKKTMDAYATWFNKLETIEDMKEAEELFESEMEPRRAFYAEFVGRLEDSPLSEEKKKRYLARFDESSRTERLEVDDQLDQELGKIEAEAAGSQENSEKEENIDVATKVKNLKGKAHQLMLDEDYEGALQLYETILKLTNNQDAHAQHEISFLKKQLSGKSSEVVSIEQARKKKAQNVLQRIMNRQSIKEKMTSVTVVQLLADMNHESELLHGGATDALRKTRGMSTEEQEIQKALHEQTEGGMILNNKGEAQKLHRINANRLAGGLEKDQLRELREISAPAQHDTKQQYNRTEFKFEDDQGRNLSGEQAVAQASQLESRLKVTLLRELAREFGITDLSNPAHKQMLQMLQEVIEEQNLKVDLKNAA